jgi:NADP-dependent 3-hydroxy acid dehydrogenase YdfG
MGRLDSKVVAITGASSGIGAATTLELAARGAAVVLGARRTDRLDSLVARILADGGRAEMLEVDVTKRADLEELVALAVNRFGRLDVLVANAGVARIAPMADLDVDDWNVMIDVNLRGVLHGIAAALPVARAIAFAIEQPDDVEIGDMTIRPARQG